jgi:hypothetical protein
MSSEHDWDTYVELAKQRGIADPTDYLQKKYMSTGRYGVPLAAVKAAIADLGITRTPIEAVEGIYIGRTHRTRGRERDQIFLAPEKGPVVAIAVDEAVGIKTALDTTPRWSKIKVTKVTEAYNSQTDNRWQEAGEGSELTSAGLATFDELVSRVVPIREIKGANGNFFTKGQMRFLNAAPAEKFDPKKPKKQLAPGERLKTLPVYDPASQRFKVIIDLREGEESVKTTLTSEHLLSTLVPPTQFEPFLKWMYAATTPDDARLDNIRSLMRGSDLYVLGRGGKSVRGAEVARAFLNLGEEGFLWTEAALRAEFDANGSATPGAPVAAPTVEAPKKSIPEQVVEYFRAHQGEVLLANLGQMSVELGYDSPEGKKQVADAMRDLRSKAGKLILQGDRYVLVESPAAPAPAAAPAVTA